MTFIKQIVLQASHTLLITTKKELNLSYETFPLFAVCRSLFISKPYELAKSEINFNSSKEKPIHRVSTKMWILKYFTSISIEP